MCDCGPSMSLSVCQLAQVAGASGAGSIMFWDAEKRVFSAISAVKDLFHSLTSAQVSHHELSMIGIYKGAAVLYTRLFSPVLHLLALAFFQEYNWCSPVLRLLALAFFQEYNWCLH